MVTTKLNLSMTEPQVRQIYAKQGDTGRVLDITLDQTPEDGTLRILRPDGVEVTSDAVTGGEVESGGTFESLAEADVTELTVGIEPVQDLSHGDPSPSNICPITGHDEVTVTRTGKNLLDPSLLQVFNSKRYISTVSSATQGTVKVQGDTSYALSRKSSLADGKIYYYDAFGNPISDAIISATNPYYFTTPPNCATIGFYVAVDSSGSLNSPQDAEPQLELGTATAYEPYQGSTYTTSLGQTVYGGTLDMVSGVLTVNRVKWIPAAVSVNSVTMTDGNAGYRFNNYLAFSGETLVDTSRLLDVTATFLKSGVSNWVTPNSITLGNDGKSFFACLSPSIGISTVSAFNSWITTNGYYIVYPLATPQTYQLTPQQIKTLVGINNVWASSGDIVNIKFTYGGLLSELPSDVTSVVGKCYCDIEQNGVSSMPFALNVKKNERQ